MSLTLTEKTMWGSSPTQKTDKKSDIEINERYEKGDTRIITETNREKLSIFVKSLEEDNNMNTRPFYQRRDRWDAKKQSRLIESFLINIPVPPIILYETDYNRYEVMDGQQRINAIRDFYNNNLALKGLEIWPELNGKRYNQLPIQIKAGIDRRTISSIVILKDSQHTEEEALELKQLAFERINTGGVSLSPQEVRNCLYTGKFNDLLIELSKNTIFVNAWKIPIHNDQKLKNNTLYQKMEDIELILRFFALRNVDNFKNGLKGFFNLYMSKARNFTDQDIDSLRKVFIETIELAHEIYHDNLFKPFNLESQDWQDKPLKNYYDAVMVGFSKHLNDANELLSKKNIIIEESKKVIQKDERKLLTGSGTRKDEIKDRIKLFNDMLNQVLAGKN